MQSSAVVVASDPYAAPTQLYGLPTGAAPLTLYQYEVCPFCCKVKAMLDYHKVSLCIRGEAGVVRRCKSCLCSYGGILDLHPRLSYHSACEFTAFTPVAALPGCGGESPD
jgi:hypothetical protein